jgi:hypothetical protein
MDAVTLRQGYRSFGLGVAPAMLTMLDQDLEGGGAAWEVGGSRTDLASPAGEVAAFDLFGGEEPGWEIVRVEPNDFTERRDTIVVTGHVYWRPRGGWEVLPVPFCHVWTLRDGRPLSVRSLLDGIELRRVEGPASRCGPER